MVFNSDYKVIKLDNGDTIIAEVDHKDWELNNYVKVKNAMQIVNFNTTPSESPFVTATIFLARWNPYTEDDVITVPLNKIITIKAKANASRRTKNRIRGFGPRFIVEKKHDLNDIMALIGKRDSESWLLREVGGPDGDPWFGWLPANEFEIVETEGFWS